MSWTSKRKITCFILCILVFFCFYLSGHYSYLLFHSLEETFSIAVSLGIFAFAWHTKRLGDNHFLVFLGIACLFVAFIDLLHTLSYKGMGVFPGFDANLPTQLWIAGRFVLSISFLVAPFFIKHKINYQITFIAYIVGTLLLLIMIFVFGVFPDCFIEGHGLTMFKKISECIIIIIFVLSIYHFKQHADQVDKYVLNSIVWSIIFLIASELCFTLYVDVYGVFNMTGHLCKVIGFYMLYKGIVEVGLTRPVDILFFDLKQKQQELSESEMRYRTLFESSHSIMLLIDPTTGAIVDANPRACSFYGYTHQELLELRISEINILSPEDVHTEMRRARTGERSHFNFRHRLASGEIRDVEVHSGVVGISGRELLCSIIHDSTEQRRAEELLRASENKYRTIFETTGTAMMMVEENATISLVNTEFVKIFGYSKEEVAGRKTLWEFVSAEDRPKVGKWHRIRRVDPDAAPRSYEARFLNREGRSRDVVLTVAIEPGTARSVVSLQDITERKRMEEELLKARNSESIAILAGGISHDFNNLLGGILGYANLASTQLASEHPAGRFIRKVEAASLQAKDLVGKFITLAAQWEPVRVRLPVGEMLAEEVWRALGDSPVKVEYDFQPDLCAVEMDAAQMRQAIHNVIVNAVEAMPNGGTLYIDASNIEMPAEMEEQGFALREGRYVKISVRDQGVGISEKNLKKVFDPYFSTKQRGSTKGMGFGLAIVQAIVSRHDGTLFVESEEGVGTVVNIYLPASA